MERKHAYWIEELAKAGPLRRSSLYRVIKEGGLIAQKAGRRTFVTEENWQAFLRSLPVVGEEGNVVRPHRHRRRTGRRSTLPRRRCHLHYWCRAIRRRRLD
jgi:hypothetical protein